MPLPRIDPSRFPGVQPDPKTIDRLIESKGTRGELRRGMSCPCVRIDTNQPALTCPACKGHGITYPEALRVRPMRAMGSGRTATAQLEAGGVIVQGDMKVTFPSRVKPAHYDLWLPDGDEHVVEERLRFQYAPEEAVEFLHRRERVQMPGDVPRDSGTFNEITGYDDRPTPMQREVLMYPEIRCIEAVVWRDRAGQIVVGIEGVDWRLELRDGAARVRFLARQPERGEAYTVRYRAPAAYVVGKTEPVGVMFGDAQLPTRCTLHRLDKRQHADLR